jgi:hypothetical protein
MKALKDNIAVAGIISFLAFVGLVIFLMGLLNFILGNNLSSHSLFFSYASSVFYLPKTVIQFIGQGIAARESTLWFLGGLFGSLITGLYWYIIFIAYGVLKVRESYNVKD